MASGISRKTLREQQRYGTLVNAQLAPRLAALGLSYTPVVIAPVVPPGSPPPGQPATPPASTSAHYALTLVGVDPATGQFTFQGDEYTPATVSLNVVLQA